MTKFRVSLKSYYRYNMYTIKHFKQRKRELEFYFQRISCVIPNVLIFFCLVEWNGYLRAAFFLLFFREDNDTMLLVRMIIFRVYGFHNGISICLSLFYWQTIACISDARAILLRKWRYIFSNIEWTKMFQDRKFTFCCFCRNLNGDGIILQFCDVIESKLRLITKNFLTNFLKVSWILSKFVHIF